MPLNLIDEAIGNWIFLKYINFMFQFFYISQGISWTICLLILQDLPNWIFTIHNYFEAWSSAHNKPTLLSNTNATWTNKFIIHKNFSCSTHKFLTKFIIQCHFSTPTLIVNNPFSLHNDTSYMVLSHSYQCKLHLQFVHLQSKCLM